MDDVKVKEFGTELTKLINRFGLDAEANTPDYILAQHMIWSASMLAQTIKLRDGWFGRFNKETQTEGEADNG